MKKMLMVVAATVAVFGAAYADGEKVKPNLEDLVVTNGVPFSDKKVFFIQHKADDGVNTVTETVDENGNVLSRSVTLVNVQKNYKSEYFKDGKAVNGGKLVRVDSRLEAINKVVTADLSNTNVAVRVRLGSTKDSKPYIQKFDKSLTNEVKRIRGKERMAEMRKRREEKKMSNDKVSDCIRRANAYNRKTKAEENKNGRAK